MILLRAIGRFTFTAVLLSLFLLGCASQQSSPVSSLRDNERVSNKRIEPEARTLFFQAERAFFAQKFDKARRGFQAVRSKYPRAEQANIMATYRLGSIHYYLGEYDGAVREFSYFLNTFPNSELAFDVRYNLGAAEYQRGNYQKAHQVLSAFRPTALRSEGNRRAEIVLQLMALSAEAVQNSGDAVAIYAAHAQLPVSSSKKNTLYDKVAFHLGRMIDAPQLERLLSEVTEPTVRGMITQRLTSVASSQVQTGSGVGTNLGQSTPRPEEPHGLPLSAGSSANRYHIGVILPLSGEFSLYGQRALEGIVLAAKSFQEPREFDFRLFVEDSESNPEVARSAVDKLFNQYNVMAIIGPLNWKEALATADRAQQLGVLNLSLNGKEGISSRGAYLFQNALTPKVQLESLISYCIEEKNYKRFAIFAPSDNFGKDMAHQFWDLAEKHGGKVVAFKTYPPKEKDFQNYIRDLTGVANVKYRKMEWDKLQEYIAEQKQKSRREPRAQLPPIIDFDALFVPDSPAIAAQIAASLAYFDATGFPLLGTTEWNSDLLYQRGGRHVEGALFPGALSMNTDNSQQKEFISAYIGAYGSAPDLLATQAYEAMYLISAALKDSSSTNRNAVVSKLRSFDNFTTPLGNISFDETRIARRKLPIFRLERGGHIVRQP